MTASFSRRSSTPHEHNAPFWRQAATNRSMCRDRARSRQGVRVELEEDLCLRPHRRRNHILTTFRCTNVPSYQPPDESIPKSCSTSWGSRIDRGRGSPPSPFPRPRSWRCRPRLSRSASLARVADDRAHHAGCGDRRRTGGIGARPNVARRLARRQVANVIFRIRTVRPGHRGEGGARRDCAPRQ